MFVVLHWGHSRSPKVLILSFVQRQRLSALAGWPWYGADNYSPSCRPDEPHRKSKARYANVHFTGTERGRCLLQGRLLFPKHFLPPWAPRVLLVTENWRPDSWSIRLCVCVCVNMQKKEALFILFNCEITWSVSGQWCICTCSLCLRRQEKIVYFLFLRINGEISVGGHLSMFWRFLIFIFGGGSWVFSFFSIPKALVTGEIQGNRMNSHL